MDILERLDGVVDVAAFEVKYFFQWIERDAFKRMPKNMQLAAGIVDEGSYWIEPVKKIRERIADWARVVGEERFGFRRRAASAAIRHATFRCCAPKWRTWSRRRARFETEKHLRRAEATAEAKCQLGAIREA